MLERQLEELSFSLDRVQALIDAPGFDPQSPEWGHARTHLEQLIWRMQVRSLLPLQKKCEAWVVELAGRMNKPVQWVAEGFDSMELPAQTQESLEVFFLHALRNSLDHGIETQAERAVVKKPPVGRIMATLRVDLADLVVSLEDDGAGPNFSRILQKAVDRKLVSVSEAQELRSEVQAGRPSRVLELLFEPGLSTASQVTEISGRGIGLDAVRSEFQKRGGRLDAFVSSSQALRLEGRIPLKLVGLSVTPVDPQSHSFWRLHSGAGAQQKLFRPLDSSWRENGPDWIKAWLAERGSVLACRSGGTLGVLT